MDPQIPSAIASFNCRGVHKTPLLSIRRASLGKRDICSAAASICGVERVTLAAPRHVDIGSLIIVVAIVVDKLAGNLDQVHAVVWWEIVEPRARCEIIAAQSSIY